MKARIHDHNGRLRIEVSHENNDERMLLRAFMREHEGCYMLFTDCVESDSLSVTFGEQPKKMEVDNGQ